MSFKPEFCVQGKWYDNAQRYATRAAAEASAFRRFMAWTMPSDWRVTESADPVTEKEAA